MSTPDHSNSPVNQLQNAAEQAARQYSDLAQDTAHRATDAAKDVSTAVKNAATDVSDAAKDAVRPLSSKVEEGVERTKEHARHLVDFTKDAGQRVTDSAKDICQSAASKAEESLATSKEYVRQNPTLVVVGAIAFGAAIGCMLMMARRKPTLRERYVDEPSDSMREAILAALAPITQRIHDQYDSAREGAGKTMDQLNRFDPRRTLDSLSDQIGRVRNNLKFW